MTAAAGSSGPPRPRPPPASARPSGSPSRRAAALSPSSGALRGRGRREGPWTRYFLRLDEHQSKTVFLSVCRFCLAAHTASPKTVPPPRKVPARRASQIPHLKRCVSVPPGQARADVDALLAAYGNLAVPYAAPSKDKDKEKDKEKDKDKDKDTDTRAARSAAAPARPAADASGADKHVARAVRPAAAAPSAAQKPPGTVRVQQPSQRPSQQAIRQFQTLVADVVFENGIPPEWVESNTLKRLVCWLQPGLERVLPTSEIISGSLLRRAAASGVDANQSDMDAFVKQGARVAVILRVEDTDPRGDGDRAALLRVLLASLSVIKCFDVQRVVYDAREDVTPRLVGEVRSVLDRVSADGTPVGSVCLLASDTLAGLDRAVAGQNPQLIVLPCFAHSINTLASAAFRTPLIRSTLLAVAETIDAILSPLAVIDGTSRAIPWQLAVFSTVAATYGTSLKLVRVEATRWASSYDAVASVLRVRSALREFATSHFGALKTHPVAHNAVTMLRDDAFWAACEALEVVLRPLAVAARRIAIGDATLAHVVSTLTDMTRSLLPGTMADGSQQGRATELYTQERALLVEVEALWYRCDVQRVALLAYLLHPETRKRALELCETKLTSAARLTESALEHYRVFFGASEPTNKLRGDLMKWRNGTLAKGVRPEEFDNWLSYWEYIRECRIAVELARLAIFVLSAAVHTATCEELWRSRSFGSRSAAYPHADGVNSLAKLKELEMARLTVERQRKAELREEAKRSPRGVAVQIRQSAALDEGMTSAVELPKVMVQGSPASNVAIDGDAMVHTGSGSQPRTQTELGLMVDSWAGYSKRTQSPEHPSSQRDVGNRALPPVDSAVASLVELVAASPQAESSI